LPRTQPRDDWEMSDRPPLPTPGVGDHVKVVAQAAVSLVPVAGGSAAVTLGAMIPSTLERRRRRWEAWIDRSLDELLGHKLDAEALCEDERFVTAVIHTTRIALGTHIEEKLQLLAGCLTSVALDPPSDFLTDRFLRWVEELSLEHFDELASHDHRRDDGHFVERINALVDGTIDHTVRLLAERDLVREGLLQSEGPERSAAFSPRLEITPLGTQLLDFVRYMTEDNGPATQAR
jgi:hypothetical protein